MRIKIVEATILSSENTFLSRTPFGCLPISLSFLSTLLKYSKYDFAENLVGENFSSPELLSKNKGKTMPTYVHYVKSPLQSKILIVNRFRWRRKSSTMPEKVLLGNHSRYLSKQLKAEIPKVAAILSTRLGLVSKSKRD